MKRRSFLKTLSAAAAAVMVPLALTAFGHRCELPEPLSVSRWVIHQVDVVGNELRATMRFEVFGGTKVVERI